jgi:hypothetical protein
MPKGYPEQKAALENERLKWQVKELRNSCGVRQENMGTTLERKRNRKQREKWPE